MAPNTASASRSPRTWAMPQSSRVIVTRAAAARQRACSAGGAAAVRPRMRAAESPACFQRVMISPPSLAESDQEDVAGMDHADRAVGQAEAERPGFVQRVE